MPGSLHQLPSDGRKHTRSGSAYLSNMQGALVADETYIKYDATPDSMDMFTTSYEETSKWFEAIDDEIKSFIDKVGTLSNEMIGQRANHL